MMTHQKILCARHTIARQAWEIYRCRINYAVAWLPLNSLSATAILTLKWGGHLIECSHARRGHRESPFLPFSWYSKWIILLEPLLPSHLHPHVLRKLRRLRTYYVYYEIWFPFKTPLIFLLPPSLKVDFFVPVEWVDSCEFQAGLKVYF